MTSFTPWNLSILVAEQEMDKMYCLAGKVLCSFCGGAQDPSTVLCPILKEMYFQTEVL